MGDYRRYIMRREAAPIAIMMYFIVAVGLVPKGHYELYPFFNWSLFSSAQNPSTDAILVVKSIDGVRLDRPMPYYELGDIFKKARARESLVAKTVDRLANAVHEGDEALQNTLLRSVEANFLAEAESAEYDLVLIGFDPIERYKTGAINRSATLKQFRKTSVAN